MPRYASSAASAVLAAGLCAIAFKAGGGYVLDAVTYPEIGAVVAGGLLVALAALKGRGGRFDGGVTLLMFGGLAVLTALSILWSISPHQTWLATNMTIAYVALFAGGIAVARLMPDGVAVVLRGVLLAAAVVVIYALVTRVFPSLAEDETYARLGAPYGYWNALGTTAALAVPCTLWLGARRTGYQPANALAYPLMSLLVVALFLSYSRGALVMAGVGAALWIAFVPLRLRSITLLGVSLLGAVPTIVWALAQDAFVKNQVTQPVREAVATEFGLFLLATVITMLGAGLAIGFRVARRPPRATARLRMGAVFGTVAVVIPIVLAVVLASSDRGLGGTIKSGYESLTSISKETPGGPSRLLSASSSRGRYWHEAKEIFEDHYWKGTGADTYGVARLRYRQPTDRTVSKHAHGFLHQMAADLGTAGVAMSLLLLFAWLVAAARAVGLRRRRAMRVAEWTPERVGLVGLALTALVYGLHSVVDWVWFVPGPTAMALVAAGFVVGRGPLTAEREAEPLLDTLELPPPPVETREEVLVGASTAAGEVGGLAVAELPALDELPPPGPKPGDHAVTPLADLPPPPPPPDRLPKPGPLPGPRPRRRPPRGLRPALALITIAVTAISAWSVWQPLRSDRESDRALTLSADGKTVEARDAAHRAHDYDPLSPRPYVVLNAVEDAAGNRPAALKALEDAVIEFPADPQTWIQLAQYQLNALSRPADALETIKGALYLDPQSRAAQTVFFQANQALSPTTPATTPPPAATPAPTPPPTTPTPPPTTPTPPPTTPVPTAPAPPEPGTGGTPGPSG